MELSFIQIFNPKRNYNRGELISSRKYIALGGVWGEQSPWQRRGSSFPDLSCARRFFKLCEIMGCSVAVPFQMMETPTTKIKERTMDSIEYVSKRSVGFLCTNRLHSGEGVQLKQDTGDIHLVSQNDAIFQGDGFCCVGGVVYREGPAQCCCDVPT